jgi:hypothetical protein
MITQCEYIVNLNMNDFCSKGDILLWIYKIHELKYRVTYIGT